MSNHSRATSEEPTALTPKANMIWNATGSILNLGCQWLITILIVRLSDGFTAAGLYSLASSIYTMFAPLGQYRMNVYQVSDVKRENTLGEYLSFRLITSYTALALCAAYAIITCKPTEVLAVILYGLYKTVTLLIEVCHACDQQNYRMDYVGQSLALQGIGSLIAFCSVFVLTSALEPALIAMTAVVALIGITLDLPRSRRFEPINLGISLSKVKSLLIKCLPIVIAGIATSAAPSLPRQMLANILGTSSLGIYASIAAPIAIIQMGATYIYNPLLRYFSDSFNDNDIPSFIRLLKKTVLGIAAVGVAATVGILLFAKPIISLLYGTKMADYAYLMIPMVPFALLTGLTWFMSDLLTAIRNFRGTFIGGVFSLAVAVIAMRPLITHFGMNGVTYTGIVSCIGSLALMSTFLIANLRLKCNHV